MIYLNIKQLREDLSGISGNTPTNVIRVNEGCGKVTVELDFSREENLNQALEYSEEEIKRLEKDIIQLNKDNEILEESNAKLIDAMAAIKDGEESITTYRDRAIAAEAKEEEYSRIMRQNRLIFEEWQAELKALRARKGVAPGVARFSHDILMLLRDLAASDYRAKNILDRINLIAS